MNKETQIQKNRPAGAKKRRRISLARLALILLLLLIAVTAGVVLLLLYAPDKPAADGLFRVQQVTVSGDTRYDAQELIAVSQIAPGQSVFNIDGERAVANLLARFPYLDEVQVERPAYNTVNLRVHETAEWAAVAYGDRWLILGENGRGLFTEPIAGTRPLRYLYLSGVSLTEQAGVGKLSLPEETLTLTRSLLAACRANGLEPIDRIDLARANAIEVSWCGQITLKLGNASRMDYQLQLVAKSLPGLLEKYGRHVCASYDLRAFTDPENTAPQAYFEPNAAG